MTTQASQTRSKSVHPVGAGTRLSLFGLGMFLLGCLVVDTSWAQGEVSFIRGDFRVGDGPFEVTVGDFNGDSHQDLATSDLFGSVVILLGRGDSTFEPARDFAVGGGLFQSP